ncbi:MAG TPA: hypothetical protein IAB26_01425 [Candidatus Limivivens merdigallinarum]|uniref:Uncharacterized protein n=1 Tax=Candidatus Limivivens merdigallinarum TaxID=2840859 RepID=A0A9D0ZSU4_9FIRM|nr:hypothetical protein [Candidatus Limivivens merdigallinarum]
MAAKWKKILLGTTLAGAAVAGGLAYFLSRKEKENSWEDDLEDFDDNLNFHEDDDEEGEDAAPVSREYVTIPTENHSASETLKDAPEASEGEGGQAAVSEDEEESPASSPIAENVKAAMDQVASRVALDSAEEDNA